LILSARWAAHRCALAAACALAAVGCGDATNPGQGSTGAQDGGGGATSSSSSSSGGGSDAGTDGGPAHGPVSAQGLSGAARGKSQSYRMDYAVGQPPTSAGKSKNYRLQGDVAGAGDQ
jgi:hypothetical protein